MVIQKESLIMQNVINATDARKEWGTFIDNVVRFKPSVIKRNRDFLAAISLEQLDLLLTPYRFTLEYELETNGSLSGSLKELDLVANAFTLEELETKIVGELIDYAQEYMNEFDKYYNAPNRKHHFPYVIRVVIQNNNDKIRSFIDARLERS